MTNDEQPPNQPSDEEQAQLNRLLMEALAPMPMPAPRHDFLRASLLQQAETAKRKRTGVTTVRRQQGRWQTLKPGIRVKPLWQGNQGNSVLIEFAAGTNLPPHRHHWLEEGIVLEGNLKMGDLQLGPFDYHASPAASRHHVIESDTGALAFLRGTSLGNTSKLVTEVLGGLLPFGKDLSKTVYADDTQAWQEIGHGVFKKQLWSDPTVDSFLYRFPAHAKQAGHSPLLNEECIILAGEIFVGDCLLQTGDYQIAPKGNLDAEFYSDVGAMLLVRGEKHR